MVEVKKADLKEALVIKFDGINFGAMDLEKAKALRDELNRYFDGMDDTKTHIIKMNLPLTGGMPVAQIELSGAFLTVKITGVGRANLLDSEYDPLLQKNVFTFLV